MEWKEQTRTWFSAKGKRGFYEVRQVAPNGFYLVWINNIQLKKRRFESSDAAKKFAEKHNSQQ